MGHFGRKETKKKNEIESVKRKVVLQGIEMIGEERVISDRYFVRPSEFRTCWISRKDKGSQKKILVHFFPSVS